jgi:Lar family restriction alleviation protein
MKLHEALATGRKIKRKAYEHFRGAHERTYTSSEVTADDWEVESEKPLPCPFCGKTDPHHVSLRYAGNDTDSGWFYCWGCQAIGPKANTKELATTAWNRRAK